MKPKGLSGFAAIALILVLLLAGYVIYQIGRLQFTYAAVKGKVQETLDTGVMPDDETIKNELSKDVTELKVAVLPEEIFVDRTISDSLRVYFEYDDSSSIFGMMYHRHLVVDVVRPVKVRL